MSGLEGQAPYSLLKEVAEELVLGIEDHASIDQFLFYKRRNEPLLSLGKLLIVDAILREERDSISYASADYYWLEQLTFSMIEGVDDDEPGRMFENVAFVTFNYDRLIEYHFANVVRRRRLNHGTASSRKILEGLKVAHVYGPAGFLPETSDATPQINFGEQNIGIERLIAASRIIQTFGEPESEWSKGAAAKLLADAQQVVFLGFSYGDQNMRMLKLDPPTPARRIFAGMYKLPGTDGESIQNSIRENLCMGSAAPFIVKDVRKAGPFIREYARTLRKG